MSLILPNDLFYFSIKLGYQYLWEAPSVFRTYDLLVNIILDISKTSKYTTPEIIKILTKNGFKPDPDSEPILTILDFNNIIMVDLEQNTIENGLRNYEFITAAGFKDGEIFVTLKLK